MSKLVKIALGVFLVWANISGRSDAKKDEKECEVCLAVVEKFRESLPNELHNDSKVADEFRTYCRNLPIGGKENRFCYFVGGTDDAATGILGSVVKPLSYGVPTEKICAQLKVLDPQICELRFEVKPDFSRLDKMKVGELRKILSTWGEGMACAGCAEKSDYLKIVKELMPKYEPEEWRKIQASQKSDL